MSLLFHFYAAMPRNCFHPVESMWLVVLYPCLRACLLLCNGSVGWCNSLHWLSPSLPVSGLSRGRTLQVFPGFCDSGCSVETVLGTICTSAALQENSGRGSIGKERQTPSQRLQICSLVCILDVYLALGCFFFFHSYCCHLFPESLCPSLLLPSQRKAHFQ